LHPPAEQYRNIGASLPSLRATTFFTFPEDASWNPDRQAVEFGVAIGEYEGVVRVSRQVFRRFIDGSVTPERCIEAHHSQRTRFECIAERKLRNRQLTDMPTSRSPAATCARPSPPTGRTGNAVAASSRLMITDAERRFPARIQIGVPPEGLGRQLDSMAAWHSVRQRHDGDNFRLDIDRRCAAGGALIARLSVS
jgi:hypothetical protein